MPQSFSTQLMWLIIRRYYLPKSFFINSFFFVVLNFCRTIFSCSAVLPSSISRKIWLWFLKACESLGFLKLASWIFNKWNQMCDKFKLKQEASSKLLKLYTLYSTISAYINWCMHPHLYTHIYSMVSSL